jgi:hypothetical protein
MLALRVRIVRLHFPIPLILFRGAVFMLIVCLSPVQATASFSAYRFAQNYILIGTDSRTTVNGLSFEDSDCKTTILDDAHFFLVEGIDRITGQISMRDLAKRVFGGNPNASTGDLVEIWMAEALSQMKELDSRNPTAIPTAPAPLPLTKGFFGEVRAGGSAWSAGVVAMNPDHASWKRNKIINQGPMDDFTSQSDDRELAVQFAADNRVMGTENIDIDARTMKNLVQFVIEHTPHSYVGGVPLVVGLEYGKGVHWYAGGDICREREPVRP